MPNYRSLVGGFYSTTPMDAASGPVAIRMNNPGAVNGAAWEREYPGYVTEVETTPGNRSTVFETPEHGVAVWYELMRRYRSSGAKTVADIIWKYGGGQSNYATTYLDDVVKRTGLSKDAEVLLVGADPTLLKFAKAMFRHEAGRDTPLSDQQILYGFELARGHAAGKPAPPATETPASPSPPVTTTESRGFWASLFAFLGSLFGRKGLVINRILRNGDKGTDVKDLQQKLYDIGFKDIVIDGDYGAVTEQAIRKFQTSQNLDPDGEVGQLTIDALNRTTGAVVIQQPPLMPPSPVKYGESPQWYKNAEKDVGFRETGVNRGIDRFIAAAHTGSLGDAWCAIWVNAKIEDSGYRGSRSPAARSFEKSSAFVKLEKPALGCVCTMWRGSPSAGTGHVFFYDGESASGVRGIGANEDDMIKRSFHTRSRITGYWWPAAAPPPAMTGIIPVSDSGQPIAGSET